MTKILVIILIILTILVNGCANPEPLVRYEKSPLIPEKTIVDITTLSEGEKQLREKWQSDEQKEVQKANVAAILGLGSMMIFLTIL
jgi:PBP1b-binding outer membrane lipoprotein LpoB